MNSNAVKSLSKLLADSYTLYLKTQNFHWNVTGPNFHSLHNMFEEQYTDLADAVDVIAERIRALGQFAPGAFSIYTEISSIKEETGVPKAQAMVSQLLADHEAVVKTLHEVLDAANAADDEVTISLVDDRMTVHEKTAWMLRSSLG